MIYEAAQLITPESLDTALRLITGVVAAVGTFSLLYIPIGRNFDKQFSPDTKRGYGCITSGLFALSAFVVGYNVPEIIQSIIK